MRINISTEKGMEKLQLELDQIQKQCRVRTVTASEILSAAEKIIEKLHISKKALNGSQACLDLNAENLLCYGNSIPESTIVTMEFCNGHWFVTDICRDRTRRAGHNVEMTLSEAAKEALIQRFSSFAI